MLKKILCLALSIALSVSAWSENIKTVMSYYQPEMSKGFIYISKTDMTLTLVDSLGQIVVTYPMACGRNLGPKSTIGDYKTPEGYFLLQMIQDASNWGHNFHDGKGFIKHAYGPYFMRLQTGFNGIGIHGTHAPESISTRATEGCIRLENNNVADLRERVTLGMPVIIGAEEGVDSLIACNVPSPEHLIWSEKKNTIRSTSKKSSKQTAASFRNQPMVVDGLLDIDPEKDLVEPVAPVEVPALKVEEPVLHAEEPVATESIPGKHAKTPHFVNSQDNVGATTVADEKRIETPSLETPVIETPVVETPVIETSTKEEATTAEQKTEELKYEVVVEEVTGPDGEVKYEVHYVPANK